MTLILPTATDGGVPAGFNVAEIQRLVYTVGELIDGVERPSQLQLWVIDQLIELRGDDADSVFDAIRDDPDSWVVEL